MELFELRGSSSYPKTFPEVNLELCLEPRHEMFLCTNVALFFGRKKKENWQKFEKPKKS